MNKKYNSSKPLEYNFKKAAEALLRDDNVDLLEVVNGNVITPSNYAKYGVNSQDYTPQMSDAVIVSYVEPFSGCKEIILFRDVQEFIEHVYSSIEAQLCSDPTMDLPF